MKWHKWNSAFVLCLVIAVGISVVACHAPPTAIPADFVTYTSKSEHFSISYPGDWQMIQAGPFLQKVTEEFAKELVEPSDANRLKEGRCIFGAGLPKGSGYMPNLGIVVVSLSDGTMDLEAMSEWAFRKFKDTMPELAVLSRASETIDGRQAVIVDYQWRSPWVGKCRYLQMQTVADKKVWTVTCSSEPQSFELFRDDFNAILNSLRIFE